jgi:hypothetical protein
MNSVVVKSGVDNRLGRTELPKCAIGIDPSVCEVVIDEEQMKLDAYYNIITDEISISTPTFR